jgi:DNA modification methylase
VKPYYADDLVQLFHGDCREITEWLAADVLVTDPPYGVRIAMGMKRDSDGKWVTKKDGRFDKVAGDQTTRVRDEALTLWGVERPALVFGRWDKPRPANTRKRLIWDKNLLGTGDLGLPWGQSDEEIYVLGQWPPIKPGGRAREGGEPTRHSSVIRVQALAPGAANRPDHPTPKPVGLMESLIAKCPPGVIADPFAGSGSTLVAAKLQGRRAIGVELDAGYCRTIAARLEQDALPFGDVS